MSAKLMKVLATGSCKVRNVRSGQVRLYWEDDKGRQNRDIAPQQEIDLIKEWSISVSALRKSESLRQLVHVGHLLLKD